MKMNTNRKMFSGIMLAAAALLTLSGCKKEEGEKVVLSAEFEQPAGLQKTYINDHSVRWTQGDTVRVNGTGEAVAVNDGTVEVEVNENGYAVAYPFTGSTLSGSGKNCTGGTVEIPFLQTYTLTAGGQQKMCSPMAARLDEASGRLYFKNLHSIIRVDVTTGSEAFALESITITSGTANLSGKQAFTFKNGGTAIDASSAPRLDTLSEAGKSVILYLSEPLILPANTTDKAFYLCVVPFTNTDLEIKVTGRPQSGTYAGLKGSYVFSRSGKSLARSIMAEVKADFGDATFEPMVYKFSVSPTLQVTFSSGNLQYQASTNTWRFAEHQWDWVGGTDPSGNIGGTVYEGGVKCNNTSISSTYTGWIDLFGWGTSGWSSGATEYQPYATSKTNSDYYPGGAETNSLTGNYANADWGVYNAIQSGSTTYPAGTWRTLTNTEWAYLLGTVAGTRGGANPTWWIYGIVTVTDADGKGTNVMGLIIYPDGTVAIPALSEGVSLPRNNKTAVSIRKADFDKLEAMGCAFLPAAGYRYGTTLANIGSNGYYWSSTYNNSAYAYNLGFFSTNLGPSNGWNRYNGCSVRLAKDVE